jgi:hypothetical protein
MLQHNSQMAHSQLVKLISSHVKTISFNTNINRKQFADNKLAIEAAQYASDIR